MWWQCRISKVCLAVCSRLLAHWASNREGPTAEHRATITLYIKLVTVGKLQVLSTGNVGQWLAEVDQI